MKPAYSYSRRFYAGQGTGAVASAEVVVPILLSVCPVSSVVDFGCGVGGWLSVFQRLGIADVLGLDGDYVPLDMLRIPAEQFRAVDLRSDPDLGRRFDVACSLEVAEHLPPECAESFVQALVNAAPVVMFSAAIPGQGGTRHINERWQSYWARLFAAHGYVALDCLRPVVYRDHRVDWWYRQNILLFCRRDRVPEGQRVISDPYDLERVDPALLVKYTGEPASTRQAATMILRTGRVIARYAAGRVRRMLPWKLGRT